jgi:hypothetical protein
MDQVSVDMKLTMDLKDHSPIELTWANGIMVNFNGPSPVDMKLTMDLKDHVLDWNMGEDHGQFQWTKPQS